MNEYYQNHKLLHLLLLRNIDVFIPRSEIVKRLWAYLKANNLQDPENKQFFTPDEVKKKFHERIVMLFLWSLFVPSKLFWLESPFMVVNGKKLMPTTSSFFNYNLSVFIAIQKFEWQTIDTYYELFF